MIAPATLELRVPGSVRRRSCSLRTLSRIPPRTVRRSASLAAARPILALASLPIAGLWPPRLRRTRQRAPSSHRLASRGRRVQRGPSRAERVEGTARHEFAIYSARARSPTGFRNAQQRGRVPNRTRHRLHGDEPQQIELALLTYCPGFPMAGRDLPTPETCGGSLACGAAAISPARSSSLGDDPQHHEYAETDVGECDQGEHRQGKDPRAVQGMMCLGSRRLKSKIRQWSHASTRDNTATQRGSNH